MKKINLLIATAAALSLAACSKENSNGGDSENPNPTQLAVKLVKADIAVDKDGFNMLTDGGFERFAGDENWKSKSLWYLPEWVSEAETAYLGKRTIFADCNSHDWRDVAIQSVCLKKNTSYTLTLNYRGAWDGLNAYMGFRATDVHDVNLNQEGVGSDWKEYSLVLSNVDDTKADVFFGGWCWDNLWFELDDVRVIPTGSNNDTFVPENVRTIASTAANASYNELKSYGKIVAWNEADGTVSAILSDVLTADGKKLSGVYAHTKGSAAEGLKFTTVGTEPVFAEGCVPTSGVTAGSLKAVRYFVPVPAVDEESDWTASEAGLAVSEDGQTWTKASAQWKADGNFVKASYLLGDKYVYMFGSAAGDRNAMAYVARVSAAKVAEYAEYEYWDGAEWVKGDEEAAAPVFFGPVDEMSVVYSPSLYTYMAIYRSSTTGGLVYRDAGLPEGEWSGEKILLLDDESARFSPSVISVGGKDITFIVNEVK